MQSWMIGMVAGTIATGQIPALPPAGVCIPLFLAGMAGLAWKSGLARFASGIACGCLLGIVWGNGLLQHRIAEDCVRQTLVVEGYIDSLPRRTITPALSVRQQFEFSVRDVEPQRCAGPRRLLLYYYGEDRMVPGERWRLVVTLRRPWGTANPGSFNMQAWFAQNGIDGVGSVRTSGTSIRGESARGSRGIQHRYRLMIREGIEELGLDPAAAAVLRAITVADKSAIGSRLWFLFQQFGLSHLLVISGLHVGMVAAVGFLFGAVWVRVLGRSNSCVPALFALGLACLFGALAGFSLPVQRALYMLGCFVLASLCARRINAFNSLLLAAVLCLLINPLAALGSGAWLSFGSVAGLLWLTVWQGRMGWAGRLICTHVFMTLLMLPLGALFFGGGSLVATLANLVMIPLVGWFVVPLGLMGSVSFLTGWPAYGVLWELAAWPLTHLLPPAELLANSAGTWIYTPLHASLPEALAGVLAVFLLILPGTRKLRVLALLLALPALLPPRPEAQSSNQDIMVTVLDVGQGTSVVIRSEDRVLLYDTGGGDPEGGNMGALVVLPYLRARGVSSLDTVVISHPDLDHSAGIDTIRDALPVARYRYGGKPVTTSGGRPCLAGEAWRWPGGQTFQFLSPAAEPPARSNNSSCVLQVQVGSFRILLPGDIEEDQERALVQYWRGDLYADWLLVAHHGSRTSSSGTFLKYVHPATAVVSSGYANRFGHPHPTVVRRLEGLEASILGTSTEGALEFTVSAGENCRVIAHRRRARRYWM